MKKNAEYIWLDGTKPTSLIRSKTRVVEISNNAASITDFPEWGFDGSSTNQASGDNSDCVLKPVSFVNDPIRGNGDFLVMCEVFNKNGLPHKSNTRAVLRKVLDQGADKEEALFGFEQEYTLFDLNDRPLGWPEVGYPGPQGPYYCAAGAGRIAGRDLVEAHLKACLEADLLIYGINAEVMLGQWEFQIGYRGFNETVDPLTTTDHLWYASWILHRLSENHNIKVSFDNKPMQGDWNGAGCHTNFSTKSMRDKQLGKNTIDNILSALEQKHDEHIQIYGADLNQRLTGDHETCDINTFRAGDSDRGASIRIPVTTAKNGYGYIEDRRPGANSDPYLVAAKILSTICNIEISELSTTKKEVIFA